MEEILRLWEEFEAWYAITHLSTAYTVYGPPTFGQFVAWYRDVYLLKNNLH